MIYHIIGDIHGQADKLVGLLNKLGYQSTKNGYQHPKGHKVIFIGDLIDRGDKQINTLSIVFNMIDHGQAHAVMGNHEYNAISYSTIGSDGDYIRKRDDNNTHQHKAFLDEVGLDSTTHAYWLSRFYELPLWLELDGANLVHACWDTKSMTTLKPFLTDDACLTHQALLDINANQDTKDALKIILKGPDSKLPNGMFVTDKNGIKRDAVRLMWWQAPLSGRPLHAISLIPNDIKKMLPAELLVAKADVDIDINIDTDKPIFIGHYWLTGTPSLLSKQVVCVDYSAGGNGMLTAYEFNTKHPTLSDHRFISYDHTKAAS